MNVYEKTNPAIQGDYTYTELIQSLKTDFCAVSPQKELTESQR